MSEPAGTLALSGPRGSDMGERPSTILGPLRCRAGAIPPEGPRAGWGSSISLSRGTCRLA
jgi:hypothetical protein